jgi:hypothetical protein
MKKSIFQHTLCELSARKINFVNALFKILFQMKNLILIILFLIFQNLSIPASAQTDIRNYPETEISNGLVSMKLYLPDPENGYYRATRFEWSGIISSLKYKGHEYFGEWKSTHDPLFHEDLCGPVEAAITPGLGYAEAKPGGKFIRIGVGILEKPDEKEYVWNQTCKILDNGEWTTDQGTDWIEFTHEINSDIGYKYVYMKRIELKKDKPGFIIKHTLKNTGSKTIETDQFNHNFFVIDNQLTGPDFVTTFSFAVRTESDLKDLIKIENHELFFTRDVRNESIWLLLEGYGTEVKYHEISVRNVKTGAGIHFAVDKPIHRLAFWATTTTLCPENFIYVSIDPGEEEEWISDYTLFIKKK